MINTKKDIPTLSDQELLCCFSSAVFRERMAVADVISHLAEIYRRRLYAKEGFSSLFSYIQKKQGYSASAAYRRIQAAKLSLRFPEIIDYLAKGKLNLMAICLIEPHVTPKNGEELLKKVMGKTKEEIEYLITSLFPFHHPEKRQDKIRRLPIVKKVIPQTTAEEKEGHLEPERLAIPLLSPENANKVGNIAATVAGAPVAVKKEEPGQAKIVEIRRVKIEFVAEERVAQKIERAKELLRRKYPEGKLSDIIEEALETFLEKKDPERKIRRMENKKNEIHHTKPVPSGRHIPEELRRRVWIRDGGQCVYRGPHGERCHEKSLIHVDHIKPWALGGETTEQNLRILCATHNRYRARQTFGTFRL